MPKSTPTPKSIAKRKHYAAIEAANLALMEQNQQAMQIATRKPKKWLTVAIEILRIIIAAVSGSAGASLL